MDRVIVPGSLDPKEYIMRYLPAYRRGEIVAYAKVDDVFADAYDGRRITLSSGYPCVCKGAGKRTPLHILVLKFFHPELFPFPDGFECDHKDRDRLNAQDENLRVVTHQVNVANASIRGHNKSGFTGVSHEKGCSRGRNHYDWWTAKVCVKGMKPVQKRFPFTPAGAVAAAQFVNSVYAYHFPQVSPPNAIPCP